MAAGLIEWEENVADGLSVRCELCPCGCERRVLLACAYEGLCFAFSGGVGVIDPGELDWSDEAIDGALRLVAVFGAPRDCLSIVDLAQQIRAAHDVPGWLRRAPLEEVLLVRRLSVPCSWDGVFRAMVACRDYARRAFDVRVSSGGGRWRA